MTCETKWGSVAVVAVALLLAGATPPASAGDDDDEGRRGPTLIGTWFLTVPSSGLTSFNSFHRDRTMTTVVSTAFGGPPRPGPPKSVDHGVWGRQAGRFEAVSYRFNFDPDTGEAALITRIRLIFDLDRGFDSASGEFLVTQWSCPAGGLDCPDPNTTAPNPPGEFAPPGNSFTMTRVRLR